MVATVAGWIAYAADRGTTVADDAASAQALQRATDYIEYHYKNRLLPGVDATLAVFDYATYEAANIELTSSGFFSKTYTPDQRKVLTAVEGIKWTVVDTGTTGVQGSMPVSTLIESMMYPYVADRHGPYFKLTSVGGEHRT